MVMACQCVTLPATDGWEHRIDEGIQRFDLKDYSGHISGETNCLKRIELGPVEFNPPNYCILTIRIKSTATGINLKKFDNSCPK